MGCHVGKPLRRSQLAALVVDPVREAVPTRLPAPSASTPLDVRQVRDDDVLPWARRDPQAESAERRVRREPDPFVHAPWPPVADAGEGGPADGADDPGPPRPSGLDDAPEPPPSVEERASGPFAPLTRVLTGLMALLVGYHYATLAGLYVSTDLPLTAGLAFVEGAIVAIILGAIAVSPTAFQRLLGRFSVVDLRRGGHVFALVLLAVSLLLVFGSLDGVGALEARLTGAPSPVGDGSLSAAALVFGLAFNVVILAIPPVVWVASTWNRPLSGAFRALGLVDSRVIRNFALGGGLAVAFIFAYIIVASIAAAILGGLPTNERADEIARSVNIPLAFAIATVAALTEELFFRGFLQARIGNFAQAVLFSVAHLSYLSVIQLLVTFVLGYVFGLAYRRTGSLWTPIGAHFTFNLIMLLLGMYATG